MDRRWLYSVWLCYVVTCKFNPGSKQSSINAFSIYHWHLNIHRLIIMQRYYYWSIYCDSHVRYYLKDTLVLILHLVITIWQFSVITWFDLMILQTINEHVFAYLINIFTLENSQWKWKLAAKFVTYISL